LLLGILFAVLDGQNLIVSLLLLLGLEGQLSGLNLLGLEELVGGVRVVMGLLVLLELIDDVLGARVQLRLLGNDILLGLL
jgi:hypothetical protein